MSGTKLDEKKAELSYTQTTIRIPSKIPGWSLDAWKFLPTSKPSPHPVIILAHGLGGNKTMGLREYAEEFAEVGYAVVVFDYRHWGASDGSPKSVAEIPEQLEDWRTVVAYCKQQAEFDKDRVVLWGTSFSGGHVVTLAGEVRFSPSRFQGNVIHLDGLQKSLGIHAGIAQCPYLGAAAHLPFDWVFVKTFVHGLVDALMQSMGYGPHYIPVCAPKGEVAVINMPNNWEGFKAIAWGLPGAYTPNEINAAIIFTLRGYQPRDKAQNICCPILLLNMTRDNLCLIEGADDCEEMIPAGLLTDVRLDGGHFDCYPSAPLYEAALRAQKEFLKKHVPV